LHFNGHLSLIGACIRGKGGGGQQNTCLHIRRRNVKHADGYSVLHSIDVLIRNLLVRLKRDSRENISPILMASPLTRFFKAHFEVASSCIFTANSRQYSPI
jgi:hypothetical protein